MTTRADRRGWREAPRLLVVAGCLAGGVAGGAERSWLDEPLQHWVSVSELPKATARAPGASNRCLADPPPSREAVQIRAAGWRPFRMFERPVTRGSVVVLGGLSALTDDCAPAAFRVFVFDGGAFAGTLSPIEMTTGRDGVVGAIRLLPDGTITAEFARYGPGDSECCPSGRVRVSYRIERGSGSPRITATDRKTLRE